VLGECIQIDLGFRTEPESLPLQQRAPELLVEMFVVQFVLVMKQRVSAIRQRQHRKHSERRDGSVAAVPPAPLDARERARDVAVRFLGNQPSV
jgi:hypothetical protein